MMMSMDFACLIKCLCQQRLKIFTVGWLTWFQISGGGGASLGTWGYTSFVGGSRAGTKEDNMHTHTTHNIQDNIQDTTHTTTNNQ